MPPVTAGPASAASDTIVAPATPPGRSAIGVVRLSGRTALQIAGRMLRREALPPREPTLATLADASGSAVDEALATAFPAPASYTGEDLVEISCHGSPPVIAFALGRALELGARMAEPGEFTRRAFRNGRLDLVQAEAVSDLIQATTLYQARVATRQAKGALSLRLRDVKSGLLELIALLEAGIDFAEDDVEFAGEEEIVSRLSPVADAVRELADGYDVGKVVRAGLRLAIVGRPNVGKSSLFNRLLRRDRAIVSPAAGTTRDAISESASFDGLPVELVDTAGIRVTADAVESEGVQRAWQSLQDADCALVVVDVSEPANAAEAELWRRVNEACPALLVGNKVDLAARRPLEKPLATVSAKTGQGVRRLRASIRNRAVPGLESLQAGSFVTNIRQERLLRQSLAALQRAAAAARADVPHEMLLLDLYDALEALDAITGATGAEDVLDRIFSAFCIGK